MVGSRNLNSRTAGRRGGSPDPRCLLGGVYQRKTEEAKRRVIVVDSHLRKREGKASLRYEKKKDWRARGEWEVTGEKAHTEGRGQENAMGQSRPIKPLKAER